MANIIDNFDQVIREPRIRPVILCGGSGTRLWPLSRKSMPKQFLKLTGERTMFQETLKGMADSDLFWAPSIVSGASFRHLVEQQAEAAEVETGPVILEPIARNTAAAIAAAALVAHSEDGEDALLLVLPSDHHLDAPEKLHATVRRAAPHARDGAIVAFGISPDRPETGFGYIECGPPLADGDDRSFQVKRFTEKPDQVTAERFLMERNYYWNSGMFLFRADRILAEIEKFCPEIISHTGNAMALAERDGRFILPAAHHFSEIPDISIDYAVMERTERAAVVAAEFQWSDMGSWSAVADIQPSDNDGNSISDNTMLSECTDTYVRSNGRLIAGIGLDNHVIIDTDDVVLVADRDKVQDIKSLVDRVKFAGHSSAENHKKVTRPWGSYESIHMGEGHQVKHIVVNPGGKLSLQYHHHRSEHWTVVSGRAEVTVGAEIRVVGANESVYIPVEVLHRIYNAENEPLHLIEVQCGDYLGEDDIVRLEDVYGRVQVPKPAAA